MKIGQPEKKRFVIDTNVILHDSACIDQFEKNDIIIPITVLEELDQFKKGHDSLNYQARQFLRRLDALSSEKLFNGGLPIGPGRGRISVRLESSFHRDLAFIFSDHKHDHQILNIAYRLFKEDPSFQTILVTKDVNMRLKARSVGLMAQDYTTDHVRDVSSLHRGIRVMENIDEAVINQLYEEPYLSDAPENPAGDPFTPNEFLILRNHHRSALAWFDPFTLKLQRVTKKAVYGITPRNAEQTFALNALLNDNIRLVSLSGKAGTGKTLLAIAAALERRRAYRQIYVARPVVPLSNRDLGYLPGDIQSKLDPYMQPLYDNLSVLRNGNGGPEKNNDPISRFMESEKFVIAPLSYIRGRSLVRIFFIVDEAQNLTPHEIKTIITRVGEGAKMVFTGDIFQIDHPYLDSQSNGLSHLIEKMQGQKLYAHVNLEKGERSELAELASDLL